jgi:hypothetical protein
MQFIEEITEGHIQLRTFENLASVCTMYVQRQISQQIDNATQ